MGQDNLKSAQQNVCISAEHLPILLIFFLNRRVVHLIMKANWFIRISFSTPDSFSAIAVGKRLVVERLNAD